MDPSSRRLPALATLFLLGLLMAVSHYAASLELSVNISQHGTLVQSVLLFLYPLSYAFVGVGAVVDHRWLRREGHPGGSRWVLRLAGLSILSFLVLALRINGLGPSVFGLVASITLSTLSLSAWFLLLGVVLSQKLSVVKTIGPRVLAQGWAVHLFGLLLGYALNRTLIMDVGVNALLLSMGLALLALPRLSLPTLGVLVLLSLVFDMDSRVERLRDLNAVQFDRALGFDKMAHTPIDGSAGMGVTMAMHEANVVHRRWSPFALFMLSSQPSDTPRAQDYVGIYNFKHQWDVSPDLDTGTLGILKVAAYSIIEPDDQVMLIGAGGGRGLTFLSIDPHPGIIAVERDPAVIELFRDRAPELNDFLYQRITAVAADGRYAAESWPEPLDFLILESARYQPLMALCSASSPYYLYTREAFASYLNALADDGLLMVNFNRTGPDNKKNYLALQIVGALRELGATVDAVALDRNASRNDDDVTYVYIMASRDPDAVERAVQATLAAGEASIPERRNSQHMVRGWEPTLSEKLAVLEQVELSDDRPFLGWFFLGPSGQRTMYVISGGILLLVLGGMLRLFRAERPQRTWNPTLFFVLIGLAHTGLQVASFYSWRSFFGDEISTMSRLLMAFLAFGALGSTLAGRYRVFLRRREVALSVTAGALILHSLGLVFIPFESSTWWIREGYALLALFPGALLMGIFFPLGAIRAHASLMGRALLADALGVLSCYALFFLVFLPLGRWAFLGMACLTYLAAALLLTDREPTA